MKYNKITSGLKTTAEMLTWMAELEKGKRLNDISIRREKEQRDFLTSIYLI